MWVCASLPYSCSPESQPGQFYAARSPCVGDASEEKATSDQKMRRQTLNTDQRWSHMEPGGHSSGIALRAQMETGRCLSGLHLRCHHKCHHESSSHSHSLPVSTPNPCTVPVALSPEAGRPSSTSESKLLSLGFYGCSTSNAYTSIPVTRAPNPASAISGLKHFG